MIKTKSYAVKSAPNNFIVPISSRVKNFKSTNSNGQHFPVSIIYLCGNKRKQMQKSAEDKCRWRSPVKKFQCKTQRKNLGSLWF